MNHNLSEERLLFGYIVVAILRLPECLFRLPEFCHRLGIIGQGHASNYGFLKTLSRKKFRNVQRKALKIHTTKNNCTKLLRLFKKVLTCSSITGSERKDEQMRFA